MSVETDAPPLSHQAESSRVDLTDVQHFVFEDASWEFYKRMLKEVGDRPIRLTYDNGRLEIMSPLPEHDGAGSVIAYLINLLAMETGMPSKSFGSTTFKRRKKKKGLEPDASFYFKNQAQMSFRRKLDLRTDPPPDLALEIDITSRSVKREPIYAALAVPELWRWRDNQLECLHLVNGTYVTKPTSLTFPFLKPADLAPFVEIADKENNLVMSRKFVAWIRSNGWSVEAPQS